MLAFGKANAAFVEENYDEAVDWYTKAIDLDSQNTELFVHRAQAYIKNENYEDAIKDCEQAIALNAQNSKAYLRKGIAEFHLNRYNEAKSSFQAGQNIDDTEKKFATWIRKCEAEINLAEEDSDAVGTKMGVAVGSDASQKDNKPEIDKPTDPAAAKSESQAAVKPENIAAAEPVEIPMPTGPKTRYDWYQTESQVILTILVKKVKEKDLDLNLQENTLSLTLKLPSGGDYSLELDLLHPIIPDKSITKVLGSKVEIKLKKADGIRWSKLERDDSLDTNVKQISVSTDPSAAYKYPSSSHYTRDWDKLVADIKKEEKDEKLEGDAAVNSLFQKIYADGSDEVKKAMNKSFSESGGTVLSTNWKDIKKEKTEIKAPDGMEWKKY